MTHHVCRLCLQTPPLPVLFNATPTTEIYTLPLHAALPISAPPPVPVPPVPGLPPVAPPCPTDRKRTRLNSSHNDTSRMPSLPPNTPPSRSFQCYADHRDLHSSPTRRSSDLRTAARSRSTRSRTATGRAPLSH